MSLSKEPAGPSEKNLWQQYLSLLVTHPIRTKALTSGATSGLATVLAQLSMGVPLHSLNYTSIRNQVILGLIRGPTIHVWMDMLTQLFDRLGYRGAAQQATPVVFGKLALDQLVFTPLHVLWFFFAIGVLEGRTLAETREKVSREFVGLILMQWRVWPLASLINFKFVPPQLRVLTLNVVGVGWMVYLVRTLAKAAATAAAAAKAVKVQ